MRDQLRLDWEAASALRLWHLREEIFRATRLTAQSENHQGQRARTRTVLQPKEGRDQECDVPIWIKEGWQWILDRALGLPSQKPDWFDLPVMRRIAITTPNVMAALRRLNRDQARPYNFALSPVIVNLSDTPVTLLGPFEKNSARWRGMSYINIHDGKHTL